MDGPALGPSFERPPRWREGLEYGAVRPGERYGEDIRSGYGGRGGYRGGGGFGGGGGREGPLPGVRYVERMGLEEDLRYR